MMALILGSAMNAMSVNVFMAGDSHVTSRTYPREVERVLKAKHPDIDFSFFGKIGASFYTYNETPAYMKEIYDARPDILIVHLGTNDSYSGSFSRQRFLENVRQFYDDVENRFPECKIVFVTPFYNRLKGHSSPNGSTRSCADALLEFARNCPNAYVVDNNADYGMYFLDHSSSLMQHDYVHLTHEGYDELGSQVGNAVASLGEIWGGAYQQETHPATDLHRMRERPKIDPRRGKKTNKTTKEQ